MAFVKPRLLLHMVREFDAPKRARRVCICTEMSGTELFTADKKLEHSLILNLHLLGTDEINFT